MDPEPGAQEHNPHGLTSREVIYLMAVVEHDGQRSAAEHLGVTVSTVKQVIARARMKLGTNTTATAYHRLREAVEED